MAARGNTSKFESVRSFLRKETVLVILLCAAGLALRFYRIGWESLFIDEGFSAYLVRLPWVDFWQRLQTDATPLYLLALRLWSSIFGFSEQALRSFSALCGVLLLPLAWRIAMDLGLPRSARVALVSFLAFNSYLIYFSQEARGYALYFLLALLCWWVYGQLQRHWTPWLAGGYWLSAMAMLFTHNHGWFQLLWQNVWLGWLLLKSDYRRKSVLWRWLILQAMVAAVVLPWTLSVASALAGLQRGWWIAPPGWLHLPAAFYQYAGNGYLLGYFSLLSLLALSVFRGTLAPALRKRQVEPDKVVFLLGWILVPVLVPFLVSFFVLPIFHVRYVAMALFPFLMLAALGWSTLPGRAGGALLLGFFLFTVPHLVQFYRTENREPWRRFARVVQQKIPSSQPVFFVNSDVLDLVFYYYFPRGGCLCQGIPDSLIERPMQLETFVQNVAREHQQVWLVFSHAKWKKTPVLTAFERFFIREASWPFVYRDLYHRPVVGIELLRLKRKQNVGPD